MISKHFADQVPLFSSPSNGHQGDWHALLPVSVFESPPHASSSPQPESSQPPPKEEASFWLDLDEDAGLCDADVEICDGFCVLSDEDLAVVTPLSGDWEPEREDWRLADVERDLGFFCKWKKYRCFSARLQ